MLYADSHSERRGGNMKNARTVTAVQRDIAALEALLRETCRCNSGIKAERNCEIREHAATALRMGRGLLAEIQREQLVLPERVQLFFARAQHALNSR